MDVGLACRPRWEALRRQKKFYAWGYADEDLTPEEIKPWEPEVNRFNAPKAFGFIAPESAEARKSDDSDGRCPAVPVALQAARTGSIAGQDVNSLPTVTPVWSAPLGVDGWPSEI